MSGFTAIWLASFGDQRRLPGFCAGGHRDFERSFRRRKAGGFSTKLKSHISGDGDFWLRHNVLASPGDTTVVDSLHKLSVSFNLRFSGRHEVFSDGLKPRDGVDLNRSWHARHLRILIQRKRMVRLFDGCFDRQRNFLTDGSFFWRQANFKLDQSCLACFSTADLRSQRDGILVGRFGLFPT